MHWTLRKRRPGRIRYKLPNWGQDLDLRRERRTLTRIQRIVAEIGTRWEPSLLFIHIPKTGGSSVTHCLKQHGLVKLFTLRRILNFVKQYPGASPDILCLDHLDPRVLVTTGLMTPEAFVETKKFAVVRNPYRRIVSSFFHHIETRRIPKSMSFKSYIQLVTGHTWRIDLSTGYGLAHANPARMWLGRSPRLENIDVFTIEDSWQIEQYLSDFLNQDVVLPHRNSRSSPRLEFPSASILEKFNQQRREDFEYGSYAMMDWARSN